MRHFANTCPQKIVQCAISINVVMYLYKCCNPCIDYIWVWPSAGILCMCKHAACVYVYTWLSLVHEQEHDAELAAKTNEQKKMQHLLYGNVLDTGTVTVKRKVTCKGSCTTNFYKIPVQYFFSPPMLQSPSYTTNATMSSNGNGIGEVSVILLFGKMTLLTRLKLSPFTFSRNVHISSDQNIFTKMIFNKYLHFP